MKETMNNTSQNTQDLQEVIYTHKRVMKDGSVKYYKYKQDKQKRIDHYNTYKDIIIQRSKDRYYEKKEQILQKYQDNKETLKEIRQNKKLLKELPQTCY